MLRNVKRAVIKVGSDVPTTTDGLNLQVIRELTAQLIDLRKWGIEIVLVSSGEIAAGLRKMGFNRKPQSVYEQGQVRQ